MMSHELIARYGTCVVFLNVLGSSLGLPLPAIPTLITVGAGTALVTHVGSSTLLHFLTILGAAVVGGLLGDLVWFQGGKRYGKRTLHTVCGLSPSREACVTTTERFFGRWGVRVLVVARFVPGLSLVAVPLCGAMAVRVRAFVLHDCAGIALWASIGLAIGTLFASQIDAIFATVARLGWQALVVIGIAPVLYFLYGYCREANDGKCAREGADQRGRIACAAREQAAAGRDRYPFRRMENARSVCHSGRADRR